MLTNEIDMLITVLAAVIGMALGAVVFMIVLMGKGNSSKLEDNSKKEQSKGPASANFNKADVLKFMEFDKIEDDMIVQENGNKYVMVL